MAPHSSTLAWKIPWTEEPGRLVSKGSPRVGHDWVTWLYFCIKSSPGFPPCWEQKPKSWEWPAQPYSIWCPLTSCPAALRPGATPSSHLTRLWALPSAWQVLLLGASVALRQILLRLVSIYLFNQSLSWGFPGDSWLKFHARSSIPWSGNEIPCATTKTCHSQINK